MLAGQILNSEATVNNFIVLGGKSFIPGSQFKLFIRVINDDLNLRYVPPATATRTITLIGLDGTDIVKSNADITVLGDDRSIMCVTIEESESENLQGGNFSFSIDVNGDGTDIKKGIVSNGLSRVIEGVC